VFLLQAPDSLLSRVVIDRFTGPRPPFDPWRWENHNSTIVGLATLVGLYLYAIGPYRRRAGVAPPVAGWRIACFLGGILVMFLALNGPIHDLSDYYLFSVHMTQHLMLTQLMPPLLLLGTPGFVLRPLLGPRWVRAVAAFLTRPVVAFVLFSVTFSAWHLQGAYDLMMRDHNVHILTHLMFMVTAVIMWWPILSPLKEYPRLSYGGQLIYLFLIGIPMMFVAALITLADVPLYTWYAPAPRIGGLSLLDDQKLGGLIMWVPGGLFFWVVMTVVFFLWVGREQQLDGQEDAQREAARAEAIGTPATGPAPR
jgi:putative membrane protein